MIASLDAEKALVKIHYPFMLKVLEISGNQAPIPKHSNIQQTSSQHRTKWRES